MSRPISAFLMDGLSALDPLSYVATGAVLGFVVVAVGWIPAWRASRIDPMMVLRRD